MDDKNFSVAMCQAAADVASVIQARALFASASAVEDLESLHESLEPPTKLILICRDEQEAERA
ncbi:MAG: hypothetical protein ACPGXK_06710, partial [Phycisphaerae bacterium]